MVDVQEPSPREADRDAADLAGFGYEQELRYDEAPPVTTPSA